MGYHKRNLRHRCRLNIEILHYCLSVIGPAEENFRVVLLEIVGIRILGGCLNQ